MATKRCCVVTADLARARIFILREREIFPPLRSEYLEEVDEVLHPERSPPGPVGAGLSDPRPGIRFGTAPRAAHPTTFDDHRLAHREESDRRFAGEVAARVGVACRAFEAEQLVVCAPAAMRGLLRGVMKKEKGPDATPVQEVDVELTSATPHEILARLMAAGLIRAEAPRPVLPAPPHRSKRI